MNSRFLKILFSILFFFIANKNLLALNQNLLDKIDVYLNNLNNITANFIESSSEGHVWSSAARSFVLSHEVSMSHNEQSALKGIPRFAGLLPSLSHQLSATQAAAGGSGLPVALPAAVPRRVVGSPRRHASC